MVSGGHGTPDDLPAVGEALHWVRATQLQIERFVESFLTETEAGRHSFLRTTADAHFLLNAAAQAEKAVNYLDKAMPADRSETLRSLRDVHEHWEQHKDSFASPRFEKRRSGKRFAEDHPDAVPWNFRLDATGTWISVLRLEDLWDEMLTLEADLERELMTEAENLGPAAPEAKPAVAVRSLAARARSSASRSSPRTS